MLVAAMAGPPSHGEGVSQLRVHRLRLPSELDRACGATPRSTVFPAIRFEVGTAKEYPGEGFDLVHSSIAFTTWATRGRSSACPAVAEAGRLMDGGRADGWRPARRQSQSGRPALLRRLHHGMCADFTGARVGAALGAQAGEAKLREVILRADLAMSDAPPKRRSTWCWRRDCKIPIRALHGAPRRRTRIADRQEIVRKLEFQGRRAGVCRIASEHDDGGRRVLSRCLLVPRRLGRCRV